MAKIIPIHPVQVADDQSNLLKALLQEIKRQLADYLENTPAEQPMIDLSSLPLLAQHIELLDDHLDKGEVNATVCDHAGSVEVWESRFPGVWRLRFRDAQGTIFLEQIEIGRIPLLLLTNPADMAQAIEKIDNFFIFSGENDV
jgi:hypothetical protein